MWYLGALVFPPKSTMGARYCYLKTPVWFALVGLSGDRYNINHCACAPVCLYALAQSFKHFKDLVEDQYGRLYQAKYLCTIHVGHSPNTTTRSRPEPFWDYYLAVSLYSEWSCRGCALMTGLICNHASLGFASSITVGERRF